MPHEPLATADLGLPEPIDPPVTNWDRYEIKELLGVGGMAQVFKAFDPQLKRYVALKFIRGEDIQLRERLLKEARAQAQIEHPHICKIYELGEVQNRYFIAMQLIHGETLARLPSELLLEQKLKILQQVADAVHVAHSMGIIHRDLKPTNIMIDTQDGGLHPFVMDFGIAREIGSPSSTATDQFAGTPSYMAPEQILGDRMQLDRRTDVYGLGATLYYLLTNRSPFEGTTLEVLMKVSKDSPIPLRSLVPSIPQDVETIVMKCLEREQGRRYESAKALSEDLKKYLSGEPIQARPPSFAYHVGKKLKKNRTMAFLLAVLLIAAGFVVYSRWRSAQELQLTRQFAQEVEAMDWMMRVAHMSPRHDIRAEKRQILQRMKVLEANMKRSGSVALGPGHYALGKGYLALQDYEKAKIHLENAWRYNHQTPQTAYALAETIGAIYQTELQQAEQIETVLLREERKKGIEKKFREPVLQYLKASKGVQTQAPEYLEALIAFYDKKYDTALESTRKAFQGLPWFYEAKILEGKIYQLQGSEKLDKGDTAGGEKNLLESERAYQKAIQIGPSDVQVYRGICTIKNELFYSAYHGTGENLEALKSNAADACAQALSVDPDDFATHNRVSFLHSVWAEHQLNRGQDCSGSIRLSLESAERAIQLNPEDEEGYSNAGLALWQQAKYETTKGLDPVTTFQLAIHRLKHAAKIDSNNASTLNGLGLTFMDLGDYKMYHGQDPRASYEEATRNFRKTLEISPGYFVGQINLGILYSAIGEYEMDHGHDPVASLRQAVESLNQACKMSPSSIYCYRWLLYVHRDLGEHQYHLGGDASSEFGAALKAFEEGKKLNPEDAFLYSEASTISLMRGEMELYKNSSPMLEMARARELLETAWRYNATDAAIHVRFGQADLLEARWNLSQKKDPSASLNRARTRFEQATKLNPGEVQGFVGIAEHYYWRARFQMSRGLDPKDSIQKGLQQINSALVVNAASAEAYGCKGMLLTLMDPVAGEAAFQKASELNRFLSKRHETYRRVH